MDFSADAMQFLSSLPYPGNIRELKNLVERTLLVCDKKTLDAADFEAQYQPIEQVSSAGRFMEGMTLEEMEKQAILDALKKYDHNLSQVAQALGITRQSLYRRLEKFGIEV